MTVPNIRRLARHLTLVIFCISAGRAAAATAPVAVAVDERVELLSIIARLAGNDVYNSSYASSQYAERVARHFEPFRGHAAIAAYKAIYEEYGASYDAIPMLAVHLDGVPTLAERIPFDGPPSRLDERWPVAPTREFLVALRNFAVASDARGFFDGERDFYAACARRFSAGIAGARAVEWFDTFIGVKPGATYRLIPGLLCGGNNYGVGVVFPDGRPEEVLPVLGCAFWDEGGLPVFAEGSISTYVHELCHSYTNQVVDRHLPELEQGGEAIYALVATQMSRMAYSNWRIMSCETLVRACVIRYVAETQGPEAAAKESAQQVARGFSWVPAVAASLERFAADRNRYRDLDDFVPEFADVMKSSAVTLAAEIEAHEKVTPRIVSMVPANGATDVDQALTTLVIRFDRPMKPGGYAFVGATVDVPEVVGKPRWDDTATILTADVRLVPGRTYHYWLNSTRYMSFRAADGSPLDPVEVTFTVADR
jgi:hypothetical protein